MGNCVLRGLSGGDDGESSEGVVRVVTSSGGVMELGAPVTADAVTTSFPGHAVFRNRDAVSPPLLRSDDLLPGPRPYYLLPVGCRVAAPDGDRATPYRVSCEGQRRGEPEVVPRYSAGVWKVKLVISPEQLSEILSQDARTEALIESVRTVAKCRGGGASSVASSDQWSSVSSSG